MFGRSYGPLSSAPRSVIAPAYPSLRSVSATEWPAAPAPMITTDEGPGTGGATCGFWRPVTFTVGPSRSRL